MESEGTGKGVKVNIKNIDPNEIMLRNNGCTHIYECTCPTCTLFDIKENMDRSTCVSKLGKH